MTGLILTTFAPVFVVIAAGYAIRAFGWVSRPLWGGVNVLNYRVLLPAILFSTTAGADIAGAAPIAAAAAVATLIAAGLGLLGARLLSLPGKAAAPVASAGAAWNVVLVLAIAERLLGPDAADAAAAAVGAGVVAGGLCFVTLFATLASNAGRARAVRRIASDPVVIAALAGCAVSLSGLALPGWLMDAFAAVGAGSLAVILLAMGAGLDFAALKGRIAALLTGALVRTIAGPVIFAGLALAFGLKGEAFTLMVVAGAAPSAAFVYAMAAEFEAETGLAAGIITLTVLTSAIVMPIAAGLALSL